jgi:probable rRNA maturation factor
MPASEPDSSALPDIDILVEAGEWPSQAKLRALTTQSLGAAVALVELPLMHECEVSFVFTDDAHIRELNRQYRSKDTPTNVLSFPGAPAGAGILGPLLGDIVLASETIAREADADGMKLDDHLVHLIVHGFLHLLGYDHGKNRDAAVMEGLETAILARLGMADPYGGGGT